MRLVGHSASLSSIQNIRPLAAVRGGRAPLAVTRSSKYNWDFDKKPRSDDRLVRELPVKAIIRPLEKVRSNNEEKVEALMASIEEVGLQEPIDVLEVEGRYYGFSGCHRYEAHKRLDLETIKCRVRKANKTVLKMHMM
ncbi:hypothetical protein BSKO_05668 [Bryopsis sp. KO-2023]|nr:hypothetical protein BSKO_05668 [Bryopsis sp. KO-2023]